MLISRAIMPMVTAVNVESLVCQLGGQLNLRRQNQLHGLLLILERMVTDHSKLFLLDCDGHSSVAHLLLHMLLDKQVISSGYVTLFVSVSISQHAEYKGSFMLTKKVFISVKHTTFQPELGLHQVCFKYAYIEY